MSSKIVECSDGTKIVIDADLELAKKIGEGKTKVILDLAKSPKEVLIVSKDSITAGNGLKKDSLQGKGVYSTITTSNVFRLLELSKISTHFIAQASSESFRARKCTMIPLEVIVRRIAAGSLLKRMPNLKMGEKFETPMVEFTFKDDNQGDPLVTDEQIVSMNLNCGGLAIDNSVLNILKSLATRAFIVLEKAWNLQQVTLVDFKVEFGVTQEKEIVIADVVDNDSWRIWPKGDPALMKDKQIYRNLPIGELSEKDRQTLIDSYKWVAMESNKLIDSLIQKSEISKSLVGIIMGSESDWETMKNAATTLQNLHVSYEVKIVSAHRTPERLFSYAKTAESRGIRVIIAGAGGAAHLPGMVSSLCSIPVLGVPVQSSALSGMDSLLSIVQMPGGIPVGTLAIGKAGAINAAILAAEILGISGNFPEILEAVKQFRKNQTESVAEMPKELQVVSQVVSHGIQPTFTNVVSPVNKQIQSIFPLKKLPPGSTIGIIGGGQLAKMTVIAAANLGYKCHIYCPEVDSPAFQVADDYTMGGYLDKNQLGLFASKVDVVTYEFENIPIETTEFLSQLTPIRPKSDVLAICQNRIKEKTFINNAGVATTPFLEISSVPQLCEALQKLGLPAILKSNTMGYDGKGQAFINSFENLEEVFARISKISSDKLCILEAFVNFDKEVSVIVVRGFTGDITTFPVVENSHQHHILKQTLVPASVSDNTRKQAEIAAVKIAEAIGLVGVLAVEMFITKEGKVLVNELAPRPHNSGHWTIEGSKTSQFEQLVRSICGLPLGKTDLVCKKATMINLLGNDIYDWEKYLSTEGAHLHVYGKKEAREGRKMGHVTILEI